ncbi:hypothetical protein C2845_PM06G01060 [Panicum miliaceum]|uniref:Uncharacterized protein n=1 Tax=Panicum miliaceum TaxID=4540 RepID=A0A3L6R5R0_PANMI|nr:hypothetical protein C2845_PM06G01060 [Panicum miliaceum]
MASWEQLLGAVDPLRFFSAATACSAHPLAPARAPRTGVPPRAARCSWAAVPPCGASRWTGARRLWMSRGWARPPMAVHGWPEERGGCRGSPELGEEGPRMNLGGRGELDAFNSSPATKEDRVIQGRIHILTVYMGQFCRERSGRRRNRRDETTELRPG